MEPTPAIGTENLIQTICQEYGIKVESLGFLQRGWGGDCYLAESSGGACYFIKLHDHENYMGVAALSMDFYLPLMHQLHTREILPNIPQPIRTMNGAFSLAVGPQTMVITNFIEGEDIGFIKLPAPILVELSNMVGILHSATSQLEFENPFIENFEAPFEHDLLKAITSLESFELIQSPGIELLKEIILPQAGEVFSHLIRLKELQLQVKSKDASKVVCHTDLHGANLRKGVDGNLFLLDWENAMIAPREHDMIFFSENMDVWKTFWWTYQAHFEQVTIDPDFLSFYHYRRGLEDVAGFLFRILAGDGGKTRDREDAEWLQENLNSLTIIEDTVRKVMEQMG